MACALLKAPVRPWTPQAKGPHERAARRDRLVAQVLQRVSALERYSHHAWAEVRAGIEQAWGELRAVYESARKRFA